MKVIIPLAGKGTRLRPHTYVTPKPMLRVAGKPVMQYVLDDVKKLPDVEQIIYITGHLKEKIEAFARECTDIPSVFVEQKVQDGTAGAVALAREYVDQPVLIIFVDTIFDADLSVIDASDVDGIIWTKEVEDYQRFGVVVTDESGFMTKIVEKPATPISKRANIGLYYIKNWQLLYEGIEAVLKQPSNKGEWYLTDAFQYMIDRGAKIRPIDVAGWYDAGKIDTLLETNRAMLDRGRARAPDRVENSTIVDPVYIENGVTIRNSIVGPNVSIGEGSSIDGSTLSDTIVETHSQISGSTLTNSLVGHHTVISGVTGEVTVGDHSEIRATSRGGKP
ncbi:MAG: sugar phosphate nucleotidyltransferase [Gemmatimonadota bacterium]|nr:sugar phosphate nucleotidyltransferase [Gemmatimonadota bacterium]